MKHLDDPIYKQIIWICLAITLILCGLTLLISQDMMYVLSILYGSILSILGFINIIMSSSSLLYSDKASLLAGAQFLVRYILYGIALFIGHEIGLNLICMMIGFMCLSLGIKIHTLLLSKGG